MKSILALALLALLPIAAHAQSGSGTRVTGSFGQSFPGSFSYQVTFNCTGEPNCSGTFLQTLIFPGACANEVVIRGTVAFTGLNLAQPGPIQGTITTTANDVNGFTFNANGTCAYTFDATQSTDTQAYAGTWDGKTGTFTVAGSDANGNPAPVPVTFTAQRSSIAPPPPVFPMTVTGGIANGVANVQASIQFRPQDVGAVNNVYVFALAPAALVRGGAAPLARDGDPPRAKEAPVQCVLAQLTASGQLTAVTSSGLASLLSSTLGASGAAVTVLNNASTAGIQGSVFYVGYGTSSQSMLNGGVNRSAITVPGAQVCAPQAPETGWWWNPGEPGRGFSIETQGGHLFMAGYLYDVTGRSTWVVSGGLTSLDGSLYTGALQAFSNGQTLTGDYRAPASPATTGQVTLAFNDARNGTLSWPGGTLPIQRFAIAAPSSAPPPAFAPESGWWWSPSEGGRGYFMEFSGSTAFIAGYMYDANGNPLWYLAEGTMPTTQAFQGRWTQYANGQTLTGAFRPAAITNANVGTVALQFQDSSHATLTFPGGRQVAITRFAF